MTSKEDLLKHFDDIIVQFEEYLSKFDDHIKSMEQEKEKVLEGRKKSEDKLVEIRAFREFVDKKVK